MFVFLAAIFSSIIGSILGLGGGFILVPILTLVLHFAIKDAIFFSLTSVFFVSILQCGIHKEIIRQNRKPLIRLGLFAAFGSIVAAWVGARSPDILISISFGLFLVAMGIFFWRSSNDLLAKFSGRLRESAADFMMVLAGISSGFFGIGGGIIAVPVLHHFLLKPMKDCTRLSFFIQFFATGTGLMVYFHSRKEVLYELPPTLLMWVLGGSLIGFIISRKIKLHDDRLKKLFATLVILVGIWKITALFI